MKKEEKKEKAGKDSCMLRLNEFCFHFDAYKIECTGSTGKRTSIHKTFHRIVNRKITTIRPIQKVEKCILLIKYK